MLRNKKILLGVTGGIAAYKCTFLVRLLVKAGAEVKVILTKPAADFVTPQSLSVLSKNTVVTDFFDPSFNWNNHVHLAEWADLFLIAPLTANTLAKMVSGQCDNVLLATYYSARCPVMIAPAMDLEMYRHHTVKKNLEALALKKVIIVPPGTGELASGLEGEGRMAEPEEVLQQVKDFFNAGSPLRNVNVLINSGPTHEPIDPVRYIGNRSSGKMGMALAEAFAGLGASVILVSGPGSEVRPHASIRNIATETAADMFKAMKGFYAEAHIVVCAAAVADFKPSEPSASKIKKKAGSLKLDLVPTVDILSELGKLKQKQVLVGFALETEEIEKYALEKLKSKNLDLIVANSASGPDAAIGGENNRVTIIDRDNKITKFELKSKREVAKDIVRHILQLRKDHVFHA